MLVADSSQAALDSLREKLEANGAYPSCQLIYHICDVTSEQSISDLISVLDAYGGVDVMVNNAGVFPADLDGDAVTCSAEAWQRTHQVNVLGTWLGCKHSILSMRRHHKQRGSVINLGSVAGLIGSATAQLAYTASKGAVIAMTRELGIVHAKEGFRFNSLCPGPLNSPMLQEFLDGEDSAGTSTVDRRQRREVHLPQGRWGEPSEVAAAALFLAADASSFINATELVVDGGLTKVRQCPQLQCLHSRHAHLLNRSAQAYVTPMGDPHPSCLPDFFNNRKSRGKL